MPEIIIRKISESDLENGFLESLDNLKHASDLGQTTAKNILNKILNDENHIIHVAEYDGKIVGSTTLLIEQKFIHQGGFVGHIEDVVVKKEFEKFNSSTDDLLKKADAMLKAVNEHSTRERQMERAIKNMDKLDS